MSLIENLTSFCSDVYKNYGECEHCSHPSGHCSGGCRKCSEEVNFHKKNGRTDYDCQKFMYYYVCRYSWKYCSEIIHLLDTINLDEYPEYRILSLGCGAAPDLMAFEEKNNNGKDILYRGYDINPYWAPIYHEIENYAEDASLDVRFFQKNIFDVINRQKASKKQYNVIVLEYLLSHFSSCEREELAEELFDGIIQFALTKRYPHSPFLIIINDIDHYEIRDTFDILITKLADNDYRCTYSKYHFKSRWKDFGDGSSQYASNLNCFSIPEKQKELFDCAITCSSAQLVIEVR